MSGGDPKIRKIISELTRIRNGLKELVGEDGAAGGGVGVGGVRGGGGDPLDEILGEAKVLTGRAADVNPEDEDVIVVDVGMVSITEVLVGGEGSKPTKPSSVSRKSGGRGEDEPKSGQSGDAKRYPKKPPPKKRK